MPEILSSATPFAAVFAAMFALDFVWAYYTKAITRHAPFAASNWAIVVTVFSAIAQIGYVENHWLVLPAALGAFAGTYSAMKWGRHAATFPLD